MALAHITLVTRDVRTSRDFFVSVFNWRPVHRPGNIDRQAAWLEMESGQQLHLLEDPAFRPSEFEAEFGRHVALFCRAAEIPALRQRLVENGAELIEPARATPFARFFFRDRNGYVFEIIDQDGFVAE